MAHLPQSLKVNKINIHVLILFTFNECGKCATCVQFDENCTTVSKFHVFLTNLLFWHYVSNH